jgi:endonuclease YncB( thermonuclease family)
MGEKVMFEYYVKKVENVVDGDTIDVVIDLGFDIMFASRVRLAGIDTPESRTKDTAEKALGLESKEYLKKHLKDAKSVVIKTEKINSSEKFLQNTGTGQKKAMFNNIGWNRFKPPYVDAIAGGQAIANLFNINPLIFYQNSFEIKEFI